MLSPSMRFRPILAGLLLLISIDGRAQSQAAREEIQRILGPPLTPEQQRAADSYRTAEYLCRQKLESAPPDAIASCQDAVKVSKQLELAPQRLIERSGLVHAGASILRQPAFRRRSAPIRTSRGDTQTIWGFEQRGSRCTPRTRGAYSLRAERFCKGERRNAGLEVEDSLLQQTLKLSSTRRNLFEFVLQQRDLLHQNATAIIEP